MEKEERIQGTRKLEGKIRKGITENFLKGQRKKFRKEAGDKSERE